MKWFLCVYMPDPPTIPIELPEDESERKNRIDFFAKKIEAIEETNWKRPSHELIGGSKTHQYREVTWDIKIKKGVNPKIVREKIRKILGEGNPK